MTYGEKLLYISTIEIVLKETDPVKRDLLLDELIDISGKGGKTRETRLKETSEGRRQCILYSSARVREA